MLDDLDLRRGCQAAAGTPSGRGRIVLSVPAGVGGSSASLPLPEQVESPGRPAVPGNDVTSPPTIGAAIAS